MQVYDLLDYDLLAGTNSAIQGGACRKANSLNLDYAALHPGYRAQLRLILR